MSIKGNKDTEDLKKVNGKLKGLSLFIKQAFGTSVTISEPNEKSRSSDYKISNNN